MLIHENEEFLIRSYIYNLSLMTYTWSFKLVYIPYLQKKSQIVINSDINIFI